MRRPIFFKIFTGFLVVTITMSVLIVAFTYEIVRSHYERTTAENLESIGIPLRDVIIPLLNGNPADSLEAVAQEYGKRLNLRITVIDPGGTVLADSVKDPTTLENHRDRLEIQQALAGKTGRSIRYSTTLRQQLLYIAIPVEVQGKTVAALRMSMPLTHIGDLLENLRNRLMGLTVLVIFLSLAVSALFSHLLSTPIRALSRAAGRIASGDFSVRVSSGTNDEIQDLTDAFNEMTRRLESTFTELSHRNEELNSIISSISEGLMVLDEEGRVLLFNEGIRKIASTENIAGRHYWELIRSPELNALIKDFTGSAASGEVEFSGRAFLCMITPLVSRNAKVVLLHDITERKQIERIKRDLVVNVSHELRTPLTAIKGFTETLIEEADPKSAEYLRIIKRHTDRLIAMVEDLLALSEIEEKPRLAAEPVDLQDLVTTALAIFDPMAREKGLDLLAECEPVIVPGDPYRLEQLLTNLVANAVKYTEKGRIVIEVSCREGQAAISVRDTGIGVSRDHLDRIFERFYVVDKSRSRNLGGTGLGLSIAKHIALLHGGRIEVESTPGAGSTFTVFLPT